MKTVINEHGCTTHPHGEPMLEVSVPFVVNGCNISEQLTHLVVANLNSSMKIEELEKTVTSLQSIVKTLQECLETRTSLVDNSTASEEVVSAVKSGRKSTKSTPTEAISPTTV